MILFGIKFEFESKEDYDVMKRYYNGHRQIGGAINHAMEYFKNAHVKRRLPRKFINSVERFLELMVDLLF